MVERVTKPGMPTVPRKVYYVQVVATKRKNEYGSLVPCPVWHPSFDGDIAYLVTAK